MLDHLRAWILSVLPVTECELHRPVRSGHAPPIEPYATLYVLDDTLQGRPRRTLDTAEQLHQRERRTARVSVDLYGPDPLALARELTALSYSVGCLTAMGTSAIASRELVVHPTAQMRATVVLTINYLQDSAYHCPAIEEVLYASDV